MKCKLSKLNANNHNDDNATTTTNQSTAVMFLPNQRRSLSPNPSRTASKLLRSRVDASRLSANERSVRGLSNEKKKKKKNRKRERNGAGRPSEALPVTWRRHELTKRIERVKMLSRGRARTTERASAVDRSTNGSTPGD